MYVMVFSENRKRQGSRKSKLETTFLKDGSLVKTFLKYLHYIKENFSRAPTLSAQRLSLL